MKLGITSPVITSHHYYALPLAIIGSDSRLCPWLYNEFIQWYTYRNREDERMHVRLYNNKNELFLYEPLEGVIITPKQLTDGNNIIDVFKGFLNYSQYVYDFVDHYYITSFNCKRHYMHDVLIYGYDDNLQVFYAYAYLGSKLAEFEIPYSEYEAAYNSDYQKAQWHCTVLYRKKEEIFYPNISRIGNHLLDYLGGINTYNREFPMSVDLHKPKFGLEIYDELKYNLEYMRKWNLNIDIPDMYCVYEHKRFMHIRIVYLDAHTNVKCPNDLKNKFAEIENAAKIMIMLVMKLNQKGLSNEINYNSLMHRFGVIKELEKNAFSEYYEYNRSVFENA